MPENLVLVFSFYVNYFNQYLYGPSTIKAPHRKHIKGCCGQAAPTIVEEMIFENKMNKQVYRHR